MTNHDELMALGEQLRQALADERRAIVELAHERLATLADTKRELVTRLSALDRSGINHPQVRELFATLRAEAQATALLGSIANAAVRLLLGYETSPSYDRQARTVAFGPSRVLAAY